MGYFLAHIYNSSLGYCRADKSPTGWEFLLLLSLNQQYLSPSSFSYVYIQMLFVSMLPCQQPAEWDSPWRNVLWRGQFLLENHLRRAVCRNLLCASFLSPAPPWTTGIRCPLPRFLRSKASPVSNPTLSASQRIHCHSLHRRQLSVYLLPHPSSSPYLKIMFQIGRSESPG